MSEPTNPLFEEEKDFLERKKLEYERALRGDVEHIKEQTVQVGKLAAIGAGIVGGIWLLSKAFGGKKKRKEWHYHDSDDDTDYAFGEDGYDEEYEANERRRRWDVSEYFDEDPHGYADSEDGYPAEPAADAATDLEDNGLSEFPDFEPHSSPRHGSSYGADFDEVPAYVPHTDVYHTDAPENEPEPAADRRFWSEEHSHPTANASALPYDDSRRLPHSNSFADLTPDEEAAQASPQAKGTLIGPAIKSFLQSETGRVIIAQVAAVAMGLVTKVVKDMMPSEAEDAKETPKTSDLAPSKAAGAFPYGQHDAPVAPQSPVLDAHDPANTTAYSATQPPLA